MDIKVLKNAILQNNVPNFMIFNVEEPTLCKSYIKTISNILNLAYKYYDNAKEILYDISTNIKDDYLYICFNDLESVNYIDEFLKYKDRHIILYFDSNIFNIKQYQDYIVTFKQLDKYTLLAYLMKILNKHKIEVTQERVEQLVDRCNCNMSLCCNELDKIIVLDQSTSNQLFDYMVKNGFSDYSKVDTFKFANKIILKDLTIFDDINKLDDSSITVLSILYRLLMTKLSNSNNIIYANIMNLCADLDCYIKDGSCSDSYILKYLLLNTFV